LATQVPLSIQDYEYENNDKGVSAKVKGRLRKCVNAWREIHAPKFLIDMILDGYKIPFMTTPPPFTARNNKSALREKAFVEEALNELLINQCIIEVDSAPEIINPLSVSIQQSGKKRLIIDLRHINVHIFKNKFRCEDISTVKEIIPPKDFMFTFDLKSGCHHVEIFKDHQVFLSFAWTFQDGTTKYFQFTVLPFGLSSAPYIFTKLLKPLIKLWRSQGKTIALFLDDGLGADRSYLLAKIFSLKVHADLFRFGFLPNETKCFWDPTQEMTWLGVRINTFDFTFRVTSKRVQHSIMSDTALILAHKGDKQPVKRLASLCGKVISCGYCIGNLSKLMTRNIYALINSAPNWSSYITLTDKAVEEIRFWKDNLTKFNGCPIRPIDCIPNKTVYSDASETGCASIISMEGEVFHQNWSELESSKSSTYRELRTVELALKSFSQKLKSQKIVWFTDNQNVAKIIPSGSKVDELQSIALQIFTICITLGISLDIQWIPRDKNLAADEISKIIDFDDYTFHDDVFNFIDVLWGPHSCDRFACHYNSKLQNFNTRYFQPGTSGVDGFTQDWSQHNNWLCPPTYLIIKTVNHAKTCGAQGTLIAPVWKSAHFWTILCPDGVHWSQFIVGCLKLPNSSKLFLKCKAKNSIFGHKPLTFETVAVRIDFSNNVRPCNIEVNI
jgi:hypothetical protein